MYYICTKTSHFTGVSAWCHNTPSLVVDEWARYVKRSSAEFQYSQGMKMCRVIASRDRYPPQVKDLVFLVIHMCPMVKARESVGRCAKPTVRPRKFATHKRHMILQKKVIIRI